MDHDFKPLADTLLEQVRTLSPSYGTSPFSVMSIRPDDLKEPQDETSLRLFLNRFDLLIVMSLWKDFDSADLSDYLELTGEIAGIPDEKNRTLWLTAQLDRLQSPVEIKAWQERCADIAIGTLIGSAEKRGIEYEILPELMHSEIIPMLPLLAEQKLYQVIGATSNQH